MPSGSRYPLRNSLVRGSRARVVRADRAFGLQRREVARHVGGADARAGAVPRLRALVEIDALDGAAAVDQLPDAGAFDVQHLRRGLGDLLDGGADVALPQRLRMHQVRQRLAARVQRPFDVAGTRLPAARWLAARLTAARLPAGVSRPGVSPPGVASPCWSPVSSRRSHQIITARAGGARGTPRTVSNLTHGGVRKHETHAVRWRAAAVNIVIPGGSGQIGQLLQRAFRAAGHDGRDHQPRRRRRRPRRVGRTHAGRVGGRDRRRRRRHQPGRAQRQLPLHEGQPRRDDELARRFDARRGSGDRARRAAAARLAADEHGDDLRASLRRAQRRGDRRHRRRRARRARVLAHQHRHRQGVGGGARRGADAAHAQGRAALGDGDEPRSRRHLRRAARADAPRAGRQHRRRAAVHVVDPRTRLRARRAAV